MKKYDWKPLSRWDIPTKEFLIKTKKVSTPLSSAICTYLLVEQTDVNGDGYIRTTPIKETEVTPEMLSIADDI